MGAERYITNLIFGLLIGAAISLAAAPYITKPEQPVQRSAVVSTQTRQQPAYTPTAVAKPTYTPTATSTATSTPIPTPKPTPEKKPSSLLEEAVTLLAKEGKKMELMFVDENSAGKQKEIYADLKARNMNATTGPDEGIDTSVFKCYPNCLFALRNIDSLPVPVGKKLIEHENRHSVQATNNPDLATDFKQGNKFTSYAAFMEACADYGLNVGPYHAEERIGELKGILKEDELLAKACEGHKKEYETLVELVGKELFEGIFPGYY